MRYRILSFCLALLFMISGVVSGIAAADSSSAVIDSADSEAVKLLEALGLMEIDAETGFFWDEMPVKRSEIAKILCKMLALEAMKDETPYFKDVSDAERAYVETAVRYGYMRGYGQEKFGPEDYVTNMQLIKIFVSLMGGGSLAEDAGGYPNGYITIGKKIGLLGGKILANEEAARRIDVAGLIYMALHTDIYEEVGFSNENIQFQSIEGHTFLTEKRNIYRFNGIISANEATSLSREDKGLGEGLVQIGEVVHRDSKHLTDSYLGANVECYVHIPKGETYGEILYVQERNNNKMIVTNDKDIIGVNSGDVSYYDTRGKSCKATVATIYSMIYNGKAVDPRTPNKLKRLESLTNADVILIDNDGDYAIDVVVVTEYLSRVAARVDAEEEKLYFDFDAVPLTLEENFYRIFKNGTEATLEDIQPGDVVLYAQSENTVGEKMIRLEVSTQSAQGNIARFRTESDGTTYITVANKEYMVSAYCQELIAQNKVKAIKAQMSGTFYLDARGNVVYLDSTIRSMLVAFLIDYAFDTGPTFSSTMQVKLYNEDNKLKTLSTDKTLIVDGVKLKIEDIRNNYAEEEKFKNATLVKYFEADGLLTEIDFPVDGYDEQEFSLDEKNTTLEGSHTQIIGDRYFLENDAKVFHIPNYKKGDAKFETVMNDPGYLFVLPYSVLSGTNTVSLYDVAESGRVKYVLRRYSPGFLVSPGDEFVAVTGVIEGIDANGDELYQIQGYNTKGVEMTAKIKDPDVLLAEVMTPLLNVDVPRKEYNKAPKRMVREGDLVQMHWGNAGYVDDICIQHSPEDTVYYTPVITVDDVNAEENRCIFGKVMYQSGSSIMVSGSPDTYTGPTSIGNKYVGNTGIAVYQYSKERQKFFKIDFEDIEKGSDVFAYVDSKNVTKMLVMYQ